MKKVLLFGGSFDPIHNGHLKLALEAYQQLKADQCLFILAKNPRWKTPETDEVHRLEMLKIALNDYPQFKISLIEYNSDREVNYTYDTILELKKYKSKKYYYLIGTDQLELLPRWYKINELSSLVQFVVFHRPGYEVNQKNLKKYNCILLNNTEYNISSTEIRELSSLDLPKAVLDYIADNNLYYFKTIEKYVRDERLAHCKSVANLSYEIACANNVNPYESYIAGLLHDIAKGVRGAAADKLMEDYFPFEKDKVGKWAYHQFIALLIAIDEFKIKNKRIIEAIKYHATGNSNMSKMAKIIYVADKLDPLRGWDSASLIDYCKENIDIAFPNVLIDNIKYFKNHDTKYDNFFTIECFRQYLKEGEY